MLSDDEKFITKLRKEIICEVRSKIREERFKENPKPSFYENWAKHQKGQISLLFRDMKNTILYLKHVDMEVLKDLEHYYQKNISMILSERYNGIEINKADKSKIKNLIGVHHSPRIRYYYLIFETIKDIRKFHELKLTDDTYENRRKAYFNALKIVNEGRDDEVFPKFPSTRILTYRTLLKLLRAYSINEEIRTKIINVIKYAFDTKSNGKKYEDIEKIRKTSSKKTKFEKEQDAKFKKIFKFKSIDSNK